MLIDCGRGCVDFGGDCGWFFRGFFFVRGNVGVGFVSGDLSICGIVEYVIFNGSWISGGIEFVGSIWRKMVVFGLVFGLLWLCVWEKWICGGVFVNCW